MSSKKRHIWLHGAAALALLASMPPCNADTQRNRIPPSAPNQISLINSADFRVIVSPAKPADASTNLSPDSSDAQNDGYTLLPEFDDIGRFWHTVRPTNRGANSKRKVLWKLPSGPGLFIPWHIPGNEESPFYHPELQVLEPGRYIFLSDQFTPDYDPSGCGPAGSAALEKEFHSQGDVSNAWLAWWTKSRALLRPHIPELSTQGMSVLEVVINADGSYAGVSNFNREWLGYPLSLISGATTAKHIESCARFIFRRSPPKVGSGKYMFW